MSYVGKEATVYVGHGAKTIKVAQYLQKEHAALFLPPTGDVLIEDLLITPLIAGRFDVGDYHEFHQYGTKGVPFLVRDMDPFNKKKSEEARESACKILLERYGEFFSAGLII